MVGWAQNAFIWVSIFSYNWLFPEDTAMLRHKQQTQGVKHNPLRTMFILLSHWTWMLPFCTHAGNLSTYLWNISRGRTKSEALKQDDVKAEMTHYQEKNVFACVLLYLSNNTLRSSVWGSVAPHTLAVRLQMSKLQKAVFGWLVVCWCKMVETASSVDVRHSSEVTKNTNSKF